MLFPEVINHSRHLLVISLTFVRNGSELKAFLRGLEPTIRLRDEVSAPIIVNSHLALVLTVSLATHWVKGTLVSGGVEVRRPSKIEVGLGELLSLSIAGALIHNLHLAKVTVHNCTVCFVHGAIEGVGGALIFDRRARNLLLKLSDSLSILASQGWVDRGRAEGISVAGIVSVGALS